jgi:hypothetical protein
MNKALMSVFTSLWLFSGGASAQVRELPFTGMSAFGGEDSLESIWELVSFIRRLPKLTPEEIKQLQEMAEGGKTEIDEKSAAPEPAGSKEKKAPKPHSHGPGTKPHVH